MGAERPDGRRDRHAAALRLDGGGHLLSWMKSVGDEVAVGDELVEIETDKANMVYEADAAGTLIEIVAEEGATLPIGEVIARVGEAGEAPGGGGCRERRREPADERRSRRPRRRAASEARGRARPEPPRAARLPEPQPPTTDGERVKASPLARRMARDAGVDLAALERLGAGRADRQGRRRGRRRNRRRSRPTPAAAALRRPPTRARARSPRPPAAAPRRSSCRSCSRRSPAGWPSRRRPRRTST